MAFDIPVSIFAIFWGISIGLVVLSFAMKPRVPVFAVVAGGVLIILIPLIDNVIVDYVEAVDYQIDYKMNTTIANTMSAYSATTTIRAEKVNNADSILFQQPISCFAMIIEKSGSPTGNVEYGIFDSTGMLVKSFGSVVANSLPTTGTFVKICLPNHDYYLPTQFDRIGARHTTSTGTDFVRAGIATVTTFDGANSIRSTLVSGAWTDTTADDMAMIIYNDKAQVVEEPVEYSLGDSTNANWYIRVYLALFGALFILIGAVEQKFGE